MPCSRMADSFSIIGCSSIGDLLFEVLGGADVVVGWRQRRGGRRRKRRPVERVLQNGLYTPVTARAGEQCPLTGGLHARVRVGLGETHDPQTGAVSHLR